MTPAKLAARRKSQAGFTLVEVIIATALGLIVLGALTSIVVTTVLASNTATGRIQASSQIRNFQLTAYDDFVLARIPVPAGCGTSGSPCTTQDLVLQGSRVANQVGSVGAPALVRYVWDSSRQEVTRYSGTSSRVAATNVSAYAWYIDRSGAQPTVVVSLTVTVAAFNTTYSESQTFLFYPRVTASPTP
jgi:prepilin-type N-terminal cleavage/methylation domain-containing protein